MARDGGTMAARLLLSGFEFQVNTDTAESQDFPSATALNDGRFVIAYGVWFQ